VTSRLSIWAHLISSLNSDRVVKAIGKIPATFDRPPAPKQFLDLYKGTHVDNEPMRLDRPRMSRSELEAEAQTAIANMKIILAEAGPVPKRTDPDYIQWANNHRKTLGLRLITEVKADGSYVLEPEKKPQMLGSCAANGCFRTGALSKSTTGAEKWYCYEHFNKFFMG